MRGGEEAGIHDKLRPSLGFWWLKGGGREGAKRKKTGGKETLNPRTPTFKAS